MATRRIQRRRERRGEPGTALLAPLVLGLGLVLACLGLLLAVVSLGSRASLFAQEPSQRDLVAEEDPDPLDLNPQPEESQDAVPFLKLVRPRRNVRPRPGQDGAQAASPRSGLNLFSWHIRMPSPHLLADTPSPPMCFFWTLDILFVHLEFPSM